VKKIVLLLVACFLLHLPAYSVKGVYIDGFASLLGNANKEDSLLNYASQNGFTYLALYELHIVNASHDLTSVPTSQILADFISKAKTLYGIQEVGACGENASWFNNIIHVYNSIHPNPAEKIDVYNLEFEFWNTGLVAPGNYYCTTYLQPAGLSCDTSGAFTFYMQQLTSIDSLATADGVKSEIYVGWFTAAQALQMVSKADRVLLHSYVSNVNNVYSYTQTRLSYLASGTSVVDVVPIFSAEPSFLGGWLNTHAESGAYTIYSNGFANETGAWKSNINLLGYQWFAYSYIPYVLSTGVQDAGIGNFRFYPNPTSSSIIVESTGNSFLQSIFLCSMDRKLLKTIINNQSSMINVDLKELSPGIYFLDCKTLNGSEKVKVVKY